MKLSRILSLSLLVAVPFFFWGGPSYHAARSLKTVWDLGHVAFFFILTILLYQIISKKRSDSSLFFRFFFIFSLIFFLGLFVEFLQSFQSGRSPDVFDLLRNQVGCLLGFLYVSKGSSQESKNPLSNIFLGIPTVILVTLVCWPFIRGVTDEVVANRQFPLLSDFETPFETMRWTDISQLEVQDLIFRHGRKSARVQLTTARYSGVSLFYFPGNWEGYKKFNFSVYNPDNEELELHCRIHDVHHKKNNMEYKDRFHQKYLLQRGWNDLTVDLENVAQAPVTRTMDMKRIERVGLFVVQQKQPRKIYIDHFYLAH